MAPWIRLVIAGLFLAAQGCKYHHDRTHVTAVPLSPQNQCMPEGIPYYLPKPLLVVAKNVRHIDESKVGLTSPAPIPNAFDDQSSYGSIKANVMVPGADAKAATNITNGTSLPASFGQARSQVEGLEEVMTPPADAEIQDQVAPDSFFTYQIVFVPDLSQKYALQVKGGPGEVRAAMNLVNGWMYTGMGPYYMKNSSTAQNIMAGGVGAMYAGRAVADVVNEVGDLAQVAGGGSQERAPADAGDVVDKYTRLARLLQSETVVPQKMLNYAELYIYEPTLMDDGSMSWNLIAEHHFDRDYFQPRMNAEAMNIFKSILHQDAAREERARQERARQERAEAGRLQEDAVKNQAPEQTTSPLMIMPNVTVLNPTDRMVASASATALETTATAPAMVRVANSPTDQIIEQETRSMLGLPDLTATPTSPTQVNVNVNPRDAPKPSAFSKLLGRFHKKGPPKIETRARRVVDLNPWGTDLPVGGRVGSTVTSSGTLPGLPK